MTPGADSPEELGALSEDAFILRDAGALGALFEPRSIVCRGSERLSASGGANDWPWEAFGAFYARAVAARRGPWAVLMAEEGVAFARRGKDLSWRYTALVLGTNNLGGTRNV